MTIQNQPKTPCKKCWIWLIGWSLKIQATSGLITKICWIVSMLKTGIHCIVYNMLRCFFGNQHKNWGTIVSSTWVSLFRHSQAYFLGVANKLCFTVGKYSIYFWWRDPVLSLHGHDSHLFFKCLGRGPNVFPSVISVELRNSNGFWRPSYFLPSRSWRRLCWVFLDGNPLAIGGKT